MHRKNNVYYLRRKRKKYFFVAALIPVVFVFIMMSQQSLFRTSENVALSKLEGTASVIDGDTIEIHNKRIRLHGIDAPKSAQTCTRNGSAYRCGKDAAFALADKLGHGIVTCHQRDTDRYGRVVAVCTQNGVDLNRWMVRQGHAIAYRKYSTDYIADEGEARAAKLGIWSGEFTNPADFRHGKR